MQVEARVSGALDAQRLRSAVHDALAAHPMARARKAPSPLSARRYYWEITTEPDLDPFGAVDCSDEGELAAARAEFQSLAVPLRESPPLRVRLAHHPSGDVLMLNVNHAACDGFGSLRILHSIARAYTGKPDPQPELDFVDARDVHQRLAADDVPTRTRRLLTLLEKLRDVVASPARIAPDGASDRPGYGFHHVSLSPQQTKALADLEHPGTVNDLLLAALHLAIAGWNEEHEASCRRIGVMVPVNLRPRDWWDEMAGNFSLPFRVSTTPEHRASPESILEELSAQTRDIKEGDIGPALIEVLIRSSALPLWEKHAAPGLLSLTRGRLVDTAILTNLGRLGEAPDFGDEAGETRELWFSAPARMPLGLSVGALTAGDRLFLAFRYRHPLFDGNAARRFADRYVSALETYAAKEKVAP